jgi:chromosome segregation ATPase
MEAERKSDLEDLKRMMERMTDVTEAKTDAKFKELTETIEKTQMELQTAEVSLDARTKNLQEELTETKNKLQARLEAVETRTERGSTPVAGASTVQPPTFDGKGT